MTNNPKRHLPPPRRPRPAQAVATPRVKIADSARAPARRAMTVPVQRDAQGNPIIASMPDDPRALEVEAARAAAAAVHTPQPAHAQPGRTSALQAGRVQRVLTKRPRRDPSRHRPTMPAMRDANGNLLIASLPDDAAVARALAAEAAAEMAQPALAPAQRVDEPPPPLPWRLLSLLGLVGIVLALGTWFLLFRNSPTPPANEPPAATE